MSDTTGILASPGQDVVTQKHKARSDDFLPNGIAACKLQTQDFF